MAEMRIEDFDLRLTLESGQFFRYTEERGVFLLLTRGRCIRISQRGQTLAYSGAPAAVIRELFQLDGLYRAQLARLSKDLAIRHLVHRYRGLRVMRQDLHETILGFICSSQSNIPKIRMNLDLIAQHCGERSGDHHHLPKPGIALNYDLVRAAKTGYRAKFLVETSKMMDDKMLSVISAADYLRAHELLCTLPGVGPKVADCVCLFALGHGEAVPVDVHIMRAMQVLFPQKRFRNPQDVRIFAQQRWGSDAGLAQQLIYQWARDSLGADVARKHPRSRAAREVQR